MQLKFLYCAHSKAKVLSTTLEWRFKERKFLAGARIQTHNLLTHLLLLLLLLLLGFNKNLLHS